MAENTENACTPLILGNMEASERLAQLDIDKYGVAKVKFSGTREKPYYSTARRFQVKVIGETMAVQTEALETAQKMKGLNSGGSLSGYRAWRRRIFRRKHS